MSQTWNNRVQTEFKINEEEKTVICIITAVNDVERRIQKYGLRLDDKIWDVHVRTYKGVAKCNPEDKWDEMYGRRLAEYRASRARQVDVNERIKAYIRKTHNQLVNLEEHGLMKMPRNPQKEEQALTPWENDAKFIDENWSNNGLIDVNTDKSVEDRYFGE